MYDTLPAHMERNLLSYFILLLTLLSPLNFQILCLGKSPTSLVTDELALLALKAHITSDQSGLITANWTGSTSVCSWVGVTCSSHHRRVAALNISNIGVTGTIPPHLGNLSFLVSLDLNYNLFSGILPVELSRLHRLKWFSIYLNNLRGEIPSWFGLLTKLEYLNLRNNSFTGLIPTSISNLSNLEYLDLSYNPLHGTIVEEVGTLFRLRHLRMYGNHLSGPIPLSIFNLSSLEILGLGINELSGSLPTDMCRSLPFVKIIYLVDNQLSGPIPSNLSQCSRLQSLILSNNHFSGQIPSKFGMHFEFLYLDYNQLDGVIPQDIGNLQKLVNFTIQDNKIVGVVPQAIFNISSLQYVNLGQNKLSGSLPREIGNFTMLRELYLHDNNLTGVLPLEIGQLQQLEVLLAGANNFTGSIPQELFNMSTLKHLSLAFNGVVGTLPTSLGSQLPNLQHLNLGSNNLHGPIPDSISNCSKLRFLALYSNKFTGFLPPSLGNLRLLDHVYLSRNYLTTESSSPELSFLTSLTNCKSLNTLEISYNPLGGTIPISIGNLSTSLEWFGANNCKIMGRIPLEIGNLSSLLTLSLNGNELTGEVPVSVKHLGKLQALDLGNNTLRGPIPDALCGLPDLIGLSLENNQFSGPILECLGNVTTLETLELTSNKLTSDIPSSIWYHKRLLRLYLGSNLLTGFLPPEMSNLSTAENIDLSMNQLSGPIPSTIGKLQNLAYLDLGHNKFQGSIPMTMGSMANLGVLNLSYNNLSGSIPMSLQTLRHLKYFNVSFNALTGEIPTDGPFKDFTKDSFIGNKALCGIERFQVPRCHRRRRVSVLLFILLGVGGCIMVTALVFIITYGRRKGKAITDVDGLMPIAPERISYYELLRATEQFSESNLIGIGSFGSVYRGILQDGKVLAIKVFNLHPEIAFRSFNVECEVLRRIRHRNLTKVIGSCSNDEFKALVLEYMPNGSLEKWLYSHNCCLDAEQRLNIMIDVAFALEYLHHSYLTPIVHCDLKPSNVLLDKEMIAHVSDFGIAKLLGEEGSIVHTTTLATLGYIAPEYGLDGLVSTRCDIYSYGIMLMETFTGKRPSHDMFVGDLSLKGWIEGSLVESPKQVIDSNLLHADNYDRNMRCFSSILELSLKCAAEYPGDRLNAKEVVLELQKIKCQFLA